MRSFWERDPVKLILPVVTLPVIKVPIEATDELINDVVEMLVVLKSVVSKAPKVPEVRFAEPFWIW